MAEATVVDAAEVARREREWADHNPPKADVDRGVLTLWNFPVGGADLSEEQVQAIHDFAKDAPMESPGHPLSDWVVLGHASLTGPDQSNRNLAQRRAEKVAGVLRDMNFQSVRTPDDGSTAPDPAGNDPQILARNRRVTVLRKVDEYRPPPKPPPPAPPERPEGLGYGDTRVKINLVLPELVGRKVKVTPTVAGDLRVFLKGNKTDLVSAGVIAPGNPPVLTEEFEKVVAEQVFRPNLGLGEPEGRELPPIKISIQAEEWFQTPKVSYGTGVISFNFKAVNARLLPVVDYNGEQVYMEFSGSIRFDIELLPETASKYPLSTMDPGPKVTAPTDAITSKDTDDPLVIAEAITDASKTASPLAQDEVNDMVLSMARRDGAACKVASEILGEVEGDPERKRRSYYWRNNVSPAAAAAFTNGSDLVEGPLIELEKEKKGARQDRVNEWKGKYDGPQREDFESIRQGVFQKLKGYDEDQGDLPQLIEGL